MNVEGSWTEACRVAHALFLRGYAHSTAGNISIRDLDGTGMWISRTDACMGFLEQRDAARVEPDGSSPHGPQPSKTAPLHQAIYEERPEARCIVHTHSSHLVALTCLSDGNPHALLPPFTPYLVMKVGRVARVPYTPPGAREAVTAVSHAIQDARQRGRHCRAIMLDRLGPVVWGKDPLAALGALEELEESARVWWLTGRTAQAPSEESLSQLQQRFGAIW